MIRSGFTFNANVCTGCQACVAACQVENRTLPDVDWRVLHTFNDHGFPGIPVFHLSLACSHCENPPCLRNCPAAAYWRDADGSVQHNAERCLGCQYCTWVCPFDAPKYSQRRGEVAKCTLCSERRQQGHDPACVTACPTGALQLELCDAAYWRKQSVAFVDSAIQSALQLDTSVEELGAPDMAPTERPEAMAAAFHSFLVSPQKKITWRAEWPLWLFTTIAWVLVALFTAMLWRPLHLGALFFGVWGSAALGISVAHLGHPFRSWRAIANLRSSWLSREIVLFGLFLAAAMLQQTVLAHCRWLGLVAAAIGFLALWAIDRLYQIALQAPPWNFHSSQTFLSALYLASLLLGQYYLLGLFAVFKLALYVRRKWRARQAHGAAHVLGWVIRLLLGFALPILGAIVLPASASKPLALTALVLVGELLDRAEFYEELTVVTPQDYVFKKLRYAFAKNCKNVGV